MITSHNYDQMNIYNKYAKKVQSSVKGLNSSFRKNMYKSHQNSCVETMNFDGLKIFICSSIELVSNWHITFSLICPQ